MGGGGGTTLHCKLCSTSASWPSDTWPASYPNKSGMRPPVDLHKTKLLRGPRNDEL